MCVHSPFLNAPVLVTRFTCTTALPASPHPCDPHASHSPISLLPTANCCLRSSFTHHISHAPYTPFTLLPFPACPQAQCPISQPSLKTTSCMLHLQAPPIWARTEAAVRQFLATLLGHQKVLCHTCPFMAGLVCPCTKHIPS